MVDTVARTPLVGQPDGPQTYGDLGFLLLGELLADLSGKPLDALYAARVREPLGLGAHFHRLSGKGHDTRDACGGNWEGLPVTGTVRPRPPAPGQGYDWAGIEPVPSSPGEVDDDNAWVLDGVAGHAGLLGAPRTSHALASLPWRNSPGQGALPRLGFGSAPFPLSRGGTRVGLRHAIPLRLFRWDTPRKQPAGCLWPPGFHRNEPLGGPREGVGGGPGDEPHRPRPRKRGHPVFSAHAFMTGW